MVCVLVKFYKNVDGCVNTLDQFEESLYLLFDGHVFEQIICEAEDYETASCMWFSDSFFTLIVILDKEEF